MEAVKEVARLTGGEVELTVHTPRMYKKPLIKTADLSQEALDYMNNRKITVQTLRDWQVKQRDWNGKPCFVFQYFDENKELQFVSYREIKKDGLKGGCEQDTMPILWGVWHVDPVKPVVIVEGQIDALSVWEAGYKNIVSVPNGANNFTWIDNCWDWLQQLQEIIIWADNDTPGRKMANELQIRLGKYRTKVFTHRRKDANDVLCHEGKAAIMNFIESAIKQTPAGLLDMSQVEIKTANTDEGIPTGFYSLDYEIEDLQPEQLTILVGRNGEGKSTWSSQVICNSIDNRIPVFLYSGEMSPQRILNWLYRQAIGNKRQYLTFTQGKYKPKADIRPDALAALRKWSANMFYTFDKTVFNVRKNTSDLFEVMGTAARRYGCKLFIIDNLMSALEDSADSANADQSNFVQRCKDFAEAYRVHVILVCHPNKNKGRDMPLEKEDISGSSHIANKADIILSIERQYKLDKDCDAKLRLLKDREGGRYIEVMLMFQESTKRLVEFSGEIFRQNEYKWEQYLKNPPLGYEVPIDDRFPWK